MAKSSKTTMVTAEKVSSQWVWLPELVDHIAAASSLTVGEARELLLTNAVHNVRPVLLERSGLHTVYRDADVNESVEEVIRAQLGETSNHHRVVTLDDAHYSNVGFSLPGLKKWMEVRKLGLVVPTWDEWMRTTYRLLKDRGLLQLDSASASAHGRQSKPIGGSVLGFDELMSVSGFSTPADIKAWLTSNDIQFKTGCRGRPFTTAKAINKALGVEANEEVALEERRVVSLL